MMPLLRIKELSISFLLQHETIDVVKNISFEIPKGKITALIGESGSGKSVTALSFMRLLPESARVKGNIFFSENGESEEDILLLSPEKIRRLRGNKIAMIFQEPMTSLNPVHTCGAQVAESLMLHKKLSKKEAKERAVELFGLVELPDPAAMFNRYPHQVSGGQKQRVMIAMAMCCDPALLIADEPTTALDVRVQKNILELLKKLQSATGMSVLLITHDLALAADVADEIIVMHKGLIVESGVAKEILSAPQHVYTKALLACRPGPESKGKKLPVIADGVIKQEETFSDMFKASSTEILLDVKDLSVSFPVKKNIFGKVTESFTAVDHVSFSINKNETVGLVGESGCGKTTLGKAILQLIRPDRGNIILKGKELNSCTEKEMRIMRKDLQVVFQDPYGSLNPRLTIGEAIEEPLKVHFGLKKKERKEKAAHLLEQVSLQPDMLNRFPHHFSGGQRQRICIARALAVEPDFLIFDESVSALDVSVQAQVLNLINDLKQRYSFTALFISHDLSVVHYISDRVMVMHKGRIIEEGPADQIFYSPREDYTKELLNAVPGKNLLL